MTISKKVEKVQTPLPTIIINGQCFQTKSPLERSKGLFVYCIMGDYLYITFLTASKVLLTFGMVTSMYVGA